MKLMLSKHFKSMLFVASGLLLVNTSCSKIDDLYNKPEGETTEILPGTSIPSNFNWSSTNNVNVNIAVEDKFDGQFFYKIELFDKDPRVEGATLLASGWAKKGQNFETKATIPAGIEYLYQRQTSPVNQVSYTMVEVKGSTVSNANAASKVAANFTPQNLNAKGITRLASLSSMNTTVSTIYNRLSSAQAVSGSANVNSPSASKAFVIEEGATFSGSLPLTNGNTDIIVYVKGKWDRSSANITAEKNNIIVVMGKGEIVSHEIKLVENTFLFVDANGTINTKKAVLTNGNVNALNKGTWNVTEKMELQAGGDVSNEGTLKVKELQILNDATVFTSSGNLEVTGLMILPSNSIFNNTGIASINELKTEANSVITNDGKMTVQLGNLKNSTLNVNCLTTFVKLNAINNSKYNIRAGARLDADVLYSDGATYNIVAGAVLNAKTSTTFGSQSSKIYGQAGAVKALALLKDVKTNGWESVLYYDNLEIVADKHPVNGQYDRFFVLNNGASLVIGDKPTDTIKSTECNAGGVAGHNNNNPTNPSTNDVVLGPFSYVFEDNWPSTVKWDFDMNDFVVDVTVVLHQNNANKIEAVTVKSKIRAAGALKRLGAGIQLDQVALNNVKSVTYAKPELNGALIPLNSIGVEAGQSKPVISLVNDVHTAFGLSSTAFVNTQKGGAVFAPVETSAKIEFNTPIQSFTFDNDLNPFIVTYVQANKGVRNEVHLVGKKGTDKINMEVIAHEQLAAGELSAADPFKSKGNSPFALMVPTSFAYPEEYQHISAAYPNFSKWVTSAGIDFQDWYNKK